MMVASEVNGCAFYEQVWIKKTWHTTLWHCMVGQRLCSPPRSLKFPVSWPRCRAIKTPKPLYLHRLPAPGSPQFQGHFLLMLILIPYFLWQKSVLFFPNLMLNYRLWKNEACSFFLPPSALGRGGFSCPPPLPIHEPIYFIKFSILWTSLKRSPTEKAWIFQPAQFNLIVGLRFECCHRTFFGH